MKKIITLILSLSVLLGVISGCTNTPKTDNKLNIVTTIFPEYDWVKEILGEREENANLTLLLDNGVDLHNYQPTANDIIKISACDMFIYVGGESDKWVEDALKEATNKNMIVINLLDVIGDAVKEEEIVEGMETEEDGEEKEFDEHIWLSIKNAAYICRYIADRLGEADARNKDTYSQNASLYIDKLNDLDGKYKTAVEEAKVNTLLFGDRFPFRYLTDDYGLKYYAAFAGCSAETEASFKTIIFLAKKADELGLKAIMQIEGSDGSIANTIKQNTALKNQVILKLNSMQSTTVSDIGNGTTYLSVMENNLKVLKEALN